MVSTVWLKEASLLRDQAASALTAARLGYRKHLQESVKTICVTKYVGFAAIEDENGEECGSLPPPTCRPSSTRVILPSFTTCPRDPTLLPVPAVEPSRRVEYLPCDLSSWA
ncbi:hypothetical protein Pmani_020401 [Petrolisthes manimaculis]|uniref:Uncharacterized protein n=1 Tax=Petrolisthes manimaculis TaxID=1843537 RepID=A0AAE1PIF6_9EUCA|nr:hypothetical protein Pmani_020401 [Petrolisthes manimaculis]